MKKTIILISLCILLIGCNNNLNGTSLDINALKVANTTSLTNITDIFTVDCTLPEAFENDTIGVVYWNESNNNTQRLSMNFIEFCKRLKNEK